MFEMIWNNVIDHIPLWLWVTMIGAGGLAAFYFASPILIPIWRMMPTPVKVVLGGLGAVFLAWMGGRYKGRKNAEEEDRRRNAEALQRRTEVDNAVDKMGTGEAEARLRDRWTRPADR